MSRWPYGAVVHHLAVAGDDHLPAGQPAVVDVLAEVAVDAGEPIARHADCFGLDLDLQCALMAGR